MLPTNTDVIIVGAGPTGLALAIALQQAGVPHVLIDKLAAGQNTSRAAVIHAHTLDVLGSIGVANDLSKRGILVNDFAIRLRDRTMLNVQFEKLPNQHPYLLMLPQDVTEKVLADRLLPLGGTIHRGYTATSVRQDEAGAEVIVTGATGEHTIRGRYVVGADGMHSLVREAAGIAFDGTTYPLNCVLADVRMDWPMGQSEVSLFFSPAGMAVVAPLPNGSFRIVAADGDGAAQPNVADIQALLDARGPNARPGKVTEVIWSSRFRIHHRLASAYRNRRLFVMGDAAHVHSPAGGQGMNCGLVDAGVLGQLLGDVIRQKRPVADLDLYEKLRRPAAIEVLHLADRLTKLATVKNPIARAVRNIAFWFVNRISPIKRAIAFRLSGVSREARAKLPPASAMPPAQVRAARAGQAIEAAR